MKKTKLIFINLLILGVITNSVVFANGNNPVEQSEYQEQFDATTMDEEVIEYDEVEDIIIDNEAIEEETTTNEIDIEAITEDTPATTEETDDFVMIKKEVKDPVVYNVPEPRILSDTEIIIFTRDQLAHFLENPESEYRTFYLGGDIAWETVIKFNYSYDFEINGIDPRTGEEHSITSKVVAQNIQITTHTDIESDVTITFKNIVINTPTYDGIVYSTRNTTVIFDNVDFTGTTLARVISGNVILRNSNITMVDKDVEGETHQKADFVAEVHQLTFEGTNTVSQGTTNPNKKLAFLFPKDPTNNIIAEKYEHNPSVIFKTNSVTNMDIANSFGENIKTITVMEGAQATMNFKRNFSANDKPLHMRNGVLSIQNDANFIINYDIPASKGSNENIRTQPVFWSPNTELHIDGGTFTLNQSNRSYVEEGTGLLNVKDTKFTNNAHMNFNIGGFQSKGNYALIASKGNDLSNVTITLNTNNNNAAIDSEGLFIFENQNKIAMHNTNLIINADNMGSILSAPKGQLLAADLSLKNVSVEMNLKNTFKRTLFTVRSLTDVENVTVDIEASLVDVRDRDGGNQAVAILYNGSTNVSKTRQINNLTMNVKATGNNISKSSGKVLFLNQDVLDLNNSHFSFIGEQSIIESSMFKNNSIRSMNNSSIEYKVYRSAFTTPIIPFQADGKLVVKDSKITVAINDNLQDVINVNGSGDTDFINTKVFIEVQVTRNGMLKTAGNFKAVNSDFTIKARTHLSVNSLVQTKDMILENTNFVLKVNTNSSSTPIMNIKGLRFNVTFDDQASNFGYFTVIASDKNDNKQSMFTANPNLNIRFDVQQINLYNDLKGTEGFADATHKYMLDSMENDVYTKVGTGSTTYGSGFENSIYDKPTDGKISLEQVNILSIGKLTPQLDIFKDGDQVVSGTTNPTTTNTASYYNTSNKLIKESVLSDSNGRFAIALPDHTTERIQYRADDFYLYTIIGDLQKYFGILEIVEVPDTFDFSGLMLKDDLRSPYARNNSNTVQILDSRNKNEHWKLELVQTSEIQDSKGNAINADMVFVDHDGNEVPMTINEPILVAQSTNETPDLETLNYMVNQGVQLRLYDVFDVYVNTTYGAHFKWILTSTTGQ